MASQNLVIGSFISFQSKWDSQDYFNGTVYFFKPETGHFGIEGVMRQTIGGDLKPVQENYGFFLSDIKNLEVILPFSQPESTTNTNKGDRKRKPGNDASSSASTSSSK